MDTNTTPQAFTDEQPPGRASRAAGADDTASPRQPRVRRPDREQDTFQVVRLEEWLPADHKARLVWSYVENIDLSALYQSIKAVDHHPGQSANDPRLFLALWLLATLEGVGSARRLEQLCERDLAFRWLCGGVDVNYHSLSAFRTEHGQLLNRLLSDSIAVLEHAGLVTYERVAQDGMKVRASAGKSSFRRRDTLERLRTEAEQHVAALQEELANDAAAPSRRQQAARERAARERQERLDQALTNWTDIAQAKEARKKGSQDTARASTTDPDARVMKMADGGYRPAYNVQFATDAASGVIVGVAVINQSSDNGQMAPMVEQIQERTGQVPKEYLADGGFAAVKDIEKVSATFGTKVYTPIKEEDSKRAKGIDPHEPLRRDSQTIAEWRRRMGTAEAKAIYKLRAQTAEWVNALARNRDWYAVRVRGLPKVQTLGLWQALVHNLGRIWSRLAG